LLVGVAVVAVVLCGVGGGLISAFEGCIVDPYTTVCSYVRPLYNVRSRTIASALTFLLLRTLHSSKTWLIIWRF
jgi:hypothetical protein